MAWRKTGRYTKLTNYREYNFIYTNFNFKKLLGQISKKDIAKQLNGWKKEKERRHTVKNKNLLLKE